MNSGEAIKINMVRYFFASLIILCFSCKRNSLNFNGQNYFNKVIKIPSELSQYDLRAFETKNNLNRLSDFPYPTDVFFKNKEQSLFMSIELRCYPKKNIKSFDFYKELKSDAYGQFIEDRNAKIIFEQNFSTKKSVIYVCTFKTETQGEFYKSYIFYDRYSIQINFQYLDNNLNIDEYKAYMSSSSFYKSFDNLFYGQTCPHSDFIF